MSKSTLSIAVLGTRGIPEVMGGVETHCQELYPRLNRKGHHITLFARKGYVASDTPYIYRGVRVVPLWNPKIKSLEAICHTSAGLLLVFFRRKEFDILHIHSIGPSLLVPLARFLGLTVVMTHHGPDYDRQKWGALAKIMLRLGERLGCRYASHVITVSTFIQRSISRLYGRNGSYIPNGVLFPDLIPAGDVTAGLGLTPGRYFLAVGRLVPEKGFHDLLAAYAGIHTDWKLLIAGEADYEDSYSRSLKESAAKDDRVIMAGFIRGRVLGELFSNAGIFVLPSYHEGLPIVLLEAMSYGLPLIASDIPANRELVDSVQTFPVGNVEVLRSKMMADLAKPQSSLVGRNRIESEFNWDRVADETEKVYYSLV